MKQIIKKNIVTICLVVFGAYLNLSSTTLSTDKTDSSIIGTWISEEDNNWKLVFKADTCYSYYDGELLRTKFYSISNSSPQCGEIVPIDNYTSYLRMTEIANSSNFNCYEINGITDKYLSLRPVSRGGVMLLLRQ